MSSRLIEIFRDKASIEKIKTKLPYVFSLAELEASRAGKVGMEVGSLRERIIVAFLIYKFGENNVDLDIPITEPEVDVKLFGAPISIKTITREGGVKAVWTVDAQSARAFIGRYAPKADILLAKINWGSEGYLYYIPVEVQTRVFRELGRDRYLRLPTPGTNPRGVEFSKEAILNLEKDTAIHKIKITWYRPKAPLNPKQVYRRWIDYWSEA